MKTLRTRRTKPQKTMALRDLDRAETSSNPDGGEDSFFHRGMKASFIHLSVRNAELWVGFAVIFIGKITVGRRDCSRKRTLKS